MRLYKREGRRVMEIQKVWAVYWSPTGGCRRVTETLAEAAAVRLGVPWECVDITLPRPGNGCICLRKPIWW